MTPDSATDGSGPYPYTMNDVFIDANPTTPSISGTTSLAETPASIVTRYLSGVHYYDTGSAFTVGVTGIDQLMRNTGRTSNNLSITPNGVGSRLPTLNQCPFGAGSGNFAGWTNNDNVDGVTYGKANWALTGSNYRLMGVTLTASASVRDTWANGNTVTSPAINMVVDTYGTSSTDTAEYFNDESRRQDSTYNGGNPAGNWDSTQTLVVGEALVCEGKIQVPNQGPIADWSTYNPSGSPNYSALGGAVSYYRTMVDTAGTNRSSMILNFSGNFLGNATADLAAEDLKVFIRRRASATGGSTGPASNPLRVHGALYNFATFDDGATVAGSYIREGTSSGNTVNVTFGGFSCETGIFIEIQIANPAITVDSLVVSFT